MNVPRSDNRRRPAAAPSTKNSMMTSGVIVDEITVVAGRPEHPMALIERLTMRAGSGSVSLVIGPTGPMARSFLGVLAGTIRPNSGTVWVKGVEVGALSAEELKVYRREQVGSVERAFRLLANASTFENAYLPLRGSGLSRSSARRRVGEVLDLVGLSAKSSRRSVDLSLGEQRRLAIARALAPEPVLLILEDPFADLAGSDMEDVVRTVRASTAGGCIVVASMADPAFGPLADQVIDLRTAAVFEDRGSMQRFTLSAGETIYTRGSWGDRVYCIDSGTIDLVYDDRTEALDTGAIFGEVGAIFGLARAHTATARTESRLRSYTAAEFIRVYGASELRRLLAR